MQSTSDKAPSRPKVSIVTATYNSEATLRDTIESVLAQDYRNVELIIVDGNSQDHTLDIVRSYGTAELSTKRLPAHSGRSYRPECDKRAGTAEHNIQYH